MAVTNHQVSVSIPEDKIKYLLTLVDTYLAADIIAVHDLRTLIGIANHFASVVYVLRPFMGELWAVLQSGIDQTTSGAVPNCVWTKQAASTLRWLR
eukprot:11385372-Heterocapsa_arctica.AAC.1